MAWHDFILIDTNNGHLHDYECLQAWMLQGAMLTCKHQVWWDPQRAIAEDGEWILCEEVY